MAEYNDKQELLKLEGEVQQQIGNLHQLLYDNMVWDDAYKAALEKNAKWFSDTYLIEESFSYLGINGWYFYSRDNELIAGFEMSVEDPNFNAFFKDTDLVNQNDLLVSGKEVELNKNMPVMKKQFFYLNNKLIIVVSHSIAPSDENGPSAGTAMVWRFVNNEFINRLTPLVKGDIELVEQPEAQAVSQQISLHLGNQRVEGVRSEDSFLYLGINNNHNELMFLLKFPAAKRLYDDALFDSSVIAGLFISLVVMVIFYVYINRSIGVPIYHLLRGVSHVMKSQDFTYRNDLKGHNELNRLSARLDQLFALLHKQRQELIKRNERLEQISNTDPLTGMANRRYLNNYLHTIAEHESTRESFLSLLVIDIDYFKNYNDLYGHSKGDDALRQVGKIFQNCTHSATDFVCRFGGEEFVIILQDTKKQDAIKVAENLCEAVRNAGIKHEGNSKNKIITISVGLACKPPSEKIDTDELFDAADKALYQAKAQGRNTVVAA